VGGESELFDQVAGRLLSRRLSDGKKSVIHLTNNLDFVATGAEDNRSSTSDLQMGRYEASATRTQYIAISQGDACNMRLNSVVLDYANVL
jgi:hypothetical protein